MNRPCRPAYVERMSDRSTVPAVLEAKICYLADLSIRPVNHTPPPGTGVPRRDGNYRDFTVRVHDARPLAGSLSLDRQAFQLVSDATAVKDFTDRDEVRRIYDPEVEALVARVTGASKVVVFDHTIRAAERGLERGHRAPVRYVHNDYTEKSAPQRVRDLLPPDEAEARLARRYVQINVWRNISPYPVETTPLGLVDAQTIAPRDLATCDLVYADRTGEVYAGVWNGDHRWYWFPRLARDEALLIKNFDSRRDGRARFSLHSAFEDPTAPADARPRESIETRTFAFFDEA